MASHYIKLASLNFAPGAPLFFIAGPCVIESERHALKIRFKLANPWAPLVLLGSAPP